MAWNQTQIQKAKPEPFTMFTKVQSFTKPSTVTGHTHPNMTWDLEGGQKNLIAITTKCCLYLLFKII